jgi:ceramide glucosyltransferase
VGGFAEIANELADDYRLGELTRDDGLRTVLLEVVVELLVADASLVELIRHEIRSLRTTRAVQSAGNFCLGITFGKPVAAIGSWMAGGSVR